MTRATCHFCTFCFNALELDVHGTGLWKRLFRLDVWGVEEMDKGNGYGDQERICQEMTQPHECFASSSPASLSSPSITTDDDHTCRAGQCVHRIVITVVTCLAAFDAFV